MNKFLSDVELYYSANIKGDEILLIGEESNHITKVMRHSAGDELFITDGKGSIYQGIILNNSASEVIVKITSLLSYTNDYKDFVFCIPKLKNPERFEFAIEKCTELGITNFIIYEAVRSIAKGDKLERWEKIVTSAMKQSLRSFKPEIIIKKRLSEILSLPGKHVIMDQNASGNFDKNFLEKGEKYYFIFGPEGGLDENELSNFENVITFKIAQNRLRSETAIIKTASLLTVL